MGGGCDVRAAARAIRSAPVYFAASKALFSVAWPVTLSGAFLTGALLARRRRTLAAALVLLASGTLLALASPRIVNELGRYVEASGLSTARPEVQYDVVVVLGGNPARTEAGAAAVREGRARYLLYAGAYGGAERVVRSELLAFGAAADRIVVEPRSRNTRENAVEAARLIAERGWRSVVILTSVSHVERAAGCFHRLGLRPDVLAVMDAPPLPDGTPRAAVLRRSSDLLHELIGRVVYRVVGYSEP